jgi:hypothetical protein
MSTEDGHTRPSRRLAAILAADIAGYSALMGADEARTVQDLKAHQAAFLPMIGQFVMASSPSSTALRMPSNVPSPSRTRCARATPRSKQIGRCNTGSASILAMSSMMKAASMGMASI